MTVEKRPIMKKKKTVIIILSIILIGSLVLAQYFLMEKQRQELIKNTKLEFEFFLKKEILKDPEDATKKLFNDINIEQRKNQEINEKNFVQELLNKVTLDTENSTKLNDIILEEMKEYDIEILKKLDKENIKATIKKKKLDLKTLRQMYEEHDFIKQLTNEIKKRETYIQKLQDLQSELNFFFENKENYYVKNGEYVCQNDEMMSKLNEFSQKYELNFKIIKESETLEPVPILYYHGVLDIPWGIHSLFVRVKDFEEQMKYLSEAGYTPIFMSEIKQASKYEKPIVITFDDGYRDVYTYAFPILKKYNFKANAYVITGSIGADAYLTNEMITEMSNSSLMEIGSHTVSHRKLATLSIEDIEYELKESQRVLEELLGKKITSIVYPSGSFDNRVIEISKKYYQYGISVIEGKEFPNHLNTYSLKRIGVYRNETIEQFKNSF